MLSFTHKDHKHWMKSIENSPHSPLAFIEAFLIVAFLHAPMKYNFARK